MGLIQKSTEYLRHNFTDAERMQMGSALADAYNQQASIESEEAVIKAQLKDRKAQVEQKIGQLSRELSAGFTMENVSCKLEYDTPNVGEVTYRREDNGEVAKVRPMTSDERQQEIQFDKPVAVNPEASVTAIDEFFGKHDEPSAEEDPIDAQLGAIAEQVKDADPEYTGNETEEDFHDMRAEALKPEHDAEFVAAPADKPKGKPGRKPKGFEGPTNPSVVQW